MQEVVVIIPIYKVMPNLSEKRSILRTKKILGSFPVVFIYPDKLDISNYENLFPEAAFQALEKKYFENISGYNRMLLSPSFYTLFKKYKYLLICQTDVYVFENKLLEWCSHGFDYIGSPWVVAPPKVKEKVVFDLNRWAVGKVGNGGFSLRKVNVFYRLSFITQWIFRIFPKNEDFIWCVLMPKIYPFLRFPSQEKALHFAFELEPSVSYQKIGQLPFAVHAWEKYEPEFWEPFLE
jgi:Protein of unknown function (DUF5672)